VRKAERLILETLTEAYPDGLTKEEVARPRPDTKRTAAVLTTLWVG
jgi:hypothetical protein